MIACELTNVYWTLRGGFGGEEVCAACIVGRVDSGADTARSALADFSTTGVGAGFDCGELKPFSAAPV